MLNTSEYHAVLLVILGVKTGIIMDYPKFQVKWHAIIVNTGYNGRFDDFWTFHGVLSLDCALTRRRRVLTSDQQNVAEPRLLAIVIAIAMICLDIPFAKSRIRFWKNVWSWCLIELTRFRAFKPLISGWPCNCVEAPPGLSIEGAEALEVRWVMHRSKHSPDFLWISLDKFDTHVSSTHGFVLECWYCWYHQKQCWQWT